jgi:glycosyltransferase involved in cell wall biosynthesis
MNIARVGGRRRPRRSPPPTLPATLWHGDAHRFRFPSPEADDKSGRRSTRGRRLRFGEGPPISTESILREDGVFGWLKRRRERQARRERAARRTAAAAERRAALQVRPASTHGITLYGLFTAPIGRGEAARRTVAAVRAAGIPCSTNTMAMAEIDNNVPFVDDAGAPAYDTAVFHSNPGAQLSRFARLLPDRRRIGVWHWELPVFPPPWAAGATAVDEVWAPSRFIAEMVEAATPVPVRLVPHAAIAEPVDRDAARAALGLPLSRRIVLTAFDFRSFPARKNPDAVLRAFADAFPAGSDAPLLLVKYHRGDPEKDAAEIARIAAAPNTIVIDRSVSQEEMRQIYGAADAFVSLHRSEGFGLNILDMMALGKACIATAFSGNMDFMSPENSIPIPWSMRAVGPGEYIHGHGQWWAEPDHDAAVAALRWIGSAADSALAGLGERARADTLRDFSLDRVAAIVRDAFAGAPTGVPKP